MGPHPLWQLEDLLGDLTFQPGQKVLDLGCGKGATSVFLVKECDVDVVAFDLSVSEDELRWNLVAAGVADRVTAVIGSARDIPFSDLSQTVCGSFGCRSHSGILVGTQVSDDRSGGGKPVSGRNLDGHLAHSPRVVTEGVQHEG